MTKSTVEWTPPTEHPNGRRGWLEKLTISVLLPLILANIAVLGWATKQIFTDASRITKLEQTSFSNEQALEVWQQISAMREAVAKLPTTSPPSWFVARVDAMEASVVRRLDSMDVKTDRIYDAAERLRMVVEQQKRGEKVPP